MSHPGYENLPHTRFDNQLIELESVDSTNNYAMAMVHEGLASDGLICLAHDQTAGKGQRGKKWISQPGANLMMTLILETSPFNLTEQFVFSAAVALGISDHLKNYGSDSWTIKWPNDIYWNDRKAAGILIENQIQGSKWSFALIGIGVNLNQTSFPGDLPNPVSLKQITGDHVDPVSLALQLRITIRNRISLLKMNSTQILKDYTQSLYRLNQIINIQNGDKSIATRLLGVDSRGFLDTEAGLFGWGEIIWSQIQP